MKSGTLRIASHLIILWLCASCATTADNAALSPEPGLLEGRRLLAAAEYGKAVLSYQAAVERNPGNKEVVTEYQNALEEVKRLADEAAARENFLEAGKGYASLRKTYPTAEKFGFLPSFSRNDADEGLRKCRSHLTQKGLDLYRRGCLKEAISVWEDLLKFDPGNGEIRKAVDTAVEQLRELEKK